MYHSIDKARENDTMGLVVPVSKFSMHMQYLRDNGFRVISLSNLAESIKHKKELSEKSVVITFDDGYKGILKYALPVLKKFGFTATVFVNINFIERNLPKELYCHNWPTLTWDDIRALNVNGISIGSHAFTHGRLAGMDKEKLTFEIVESKKTIEKNINERINLFCYPHGSYNREVPGLLEDNDFHSACSSIEGVNSLGADLFALRRTEITAFDDTPGKFERKLLGCYDWLTLLRKKYA
ncbi:MAG: polysaccharide deacetylase family protein [Candidatus Omnitrophota bacterium]|nr:MAG: polysaccharide deacetylase family protein [Candidatus Omnitrophota bacterium]